MREESDRGTPYPQICLIRFPKKLKKKLNWKGKGFQVKIPTFSNIGIRDLTHLRFADDIIVLIAKNGSELGRMGEDLKEASEEIGLNINLSKFKVLLNIPALGEIKLTEVKIERVTEY